VGEARVGAFPDPNLDGSEGWEESVHMPTSVTYITEEHFLFVEGAMAHLTLGVLGGGAAVGVGGGWYGCGKG